MALFGIFATHSPESCPMNNQQNKDTMIQIDDAIKSIPKEFPIEKIHEFYLSVLEHLWIIIVEADSAHEIETMCIETGISTFNTVKIVPLSTFDTVMKKIRRK